MVNETNLPQSDVRHTLPGVVAILLWSTTIAFSRSLTEQLGTFTAATLIYALAGLLGLALAEMQERGSLRKMLRLSRAYLWGCGGLFVAYIVTLYLSVGMASSRTEVLAVGLINYLWPGLSLTFSIPILKQKGSLWLPVGIILALVGVWFASTASSGDPLNTGAIFTKSSLLPYGLAFTAAVCWGLYSNLSRRWGGAQEEGAVPLFLLASGLILGLLRFTTTETPHWESTTWLELAYMAIFPAMLAYVLWDIAIRKGKIILVASLSYLTPLLSTLFSMLVLHVSSGTGLWIGAFLVVVGAVICKLSISER